MTDWIKSLTLTLACLLMAGQSSGQTAFNDRGSFYNPLLFIEATSPVKDIVTLRFANNEEYYYSHFLITEQGVVVFDPLSDSAAAAFVEQIRHWAPGKPLLAIVYSHLHTDHIAGARVLTKAFGSVPIIAHQRTANYFKRRPVPFVLAPTELVTDAGRDFHFGQYTLQLRYLSDVHTASILVAIVPELEVAYTVDYVNNDVVGWTDLPGINLDQMLEAQRKTLALPVKTYLFGHGAPGGKAAIERQLDYFQTLQQAVQAALEQGLTEAQAVSQIQLEQFSHFANYKDWFKGNVRAFYRWEQAREQ